MSKELSIIDTAITSGVFQTFTRLLGGSELERKLRSEDSFTLFAPLDIAFAYLPAGTLNKLLPAQSQGVLIDVLSYHAVRGRFMYYELVEMFEAKSEQGEKTDHQPHRRIES